MDAHRPILNTTGRNVRIAVLDSGVNPAFPLLRHRSGRVFSCQKDNDEHRIAPLRNDENSDRNGHGSYVESCIRSVAPDATIDHFRILDAHNSCPGTLLCYVLDHVVDLGYHLVNLSLGTRNESLVPWLVTIMKRAYENEVTLVAASSNVGATLYPSRFTDCLSCDAMAATHPLQVRFRPRNVIEFAAWGVDIPIEGPNGAVRLTGSSYAAGHLCGLAARAIEHLGGRPSPLDVKIALRDFARSSPLEQEAS